MLADLVDPDDGGGRPVCPLATRGLRALFAWFGKIDQHWSIEDVIAEDDEVVIRATNRCVQVGFFDVPGRGVKQVSTATFILQITDGLVCCVELQSSRSARRGTFGRGRRRGARR